MARPRRSEREDIIVRPYQRDDDAQVRRIFRDGMWETLVGGIRSQLLWPFLGAACGSAVLGALLGRKAGEHAVAGACAGFAATSLALFGWLPRKIAQSYVDHSLEDDLKDIAERYRSRPTATEGETGYAGFWVACISDGDGKGAKKVIGTVAVEPPREGPNEGITWFKSGDCELRRMSVSREYRGLGVAGKLYKVLEDECKKHGVKRIVLSTSAFQAGAVRMYPRLGFYVDQHVHLNYYGVPFHIYYFAKDLV